MRSRPSSPCRPLRQRRPRDATRVGATVADPAAGLKVQIHPAHQAPGARSLAYGLSRPATEGAIADLGERKKLRPMSDPVAGWPDAAAARAQAAKQKADVKAKKEAFLALQARYTREAGYRVSDYEVGLASAAEQRGAGLWLAISHRTDPLTRNPEGGAVVGQSSAAVGRHRLGRGTRGVESTAS